MRPPAWLHRPGPCARARRTRSRQRRDERRRRSSASEPGNSPARRACPPARGSPTSSSTSVSEWSETKAIGTTSTATPSCAARSISASVLGPIQLLRRRARLVADHPVQLASPQSASTARHGLLDLPLVRIARDARSTSGRPCAENSTRSRIVGSSCIRAASYAERSSAVEAAT